MICDVGKLVTPQILVKLLQSHYDGQTLFVNLSVVFLSMRETSGVIRYGFLCTIFHDVSKNGPNAVWRAITGEYQRFGGVKVSHDLWGTQHLFRLVEGHLVSFFST